MPSTVPRMSSQWERRRRSVAKQRSVRAVNTSQANGQKLRLRAPRKRSRGPLLSVVHRSTRLPRWDTYGRYSQGVAARSIDRTKWAAVVSRLVADETGGNKSRFAALVGVTYKTVHRWMTEASDVSEDSVRDVARALHMSPLELLLRVGYYTEQELDAAVAQERQLAVSEDDPALRVILEADVPPRVKQRMIQRLQQLRSREAERQVDEVKWWIDQARGA